MSKNNNMSFKLNYETIQLLKALYYINLNYPQIGNIVSSFLI